MHNVSYFTTVSSAQWHAGLTAIRPGFTMARAPVFHTIKVITWDLQNCCSKDSLSTMP